MKPQHLMVRLFAALGAAVAMHAAAEAPAPATIPAEVFFSHPAVIDVKLAPGGRRLAMVAPVRERRVLVVQDLEGERKSRAVAHFADADIGAFHWVNDEYLVFSQFDAQAGIGDQRFAPGLFSVAATGGAVRALIRVEGQVIRTEHRIGREPLDWNHGLLRVLRDGSNEVIIGEASASAGDLRSVSPLRLDVLTGRTRSLALGMPAAAQRTLFDARGEPRVVVTGSRKGQREVHLRLEGQSEWKLAATQATTRPPWSPHSIAKDGRLLVTTTVGNGETGVLRYLDAATGQPEPHDVVATPGFSFSGATIIDDASAAPLGLRVETDGVTTLWLEPRLAALQAAIDQRLPGRVNLIACSQCLSAQPVLLVRSWSDRQPEEFYLYRPTQAEAPLTLVARTRPAVVAQQMASLDMHRVKMRDGLEIPVWVTRRAGAAGAAPPPAVVLVHGGPFVRGVHWHWDPQAQFLAARGYVVIQPEFRGSTGYGGRLYRAGFKQWGRGMLDDLADALAWAAGQGWVDARRVCIVGASYGGYAALMAPIRHPGLYRCAVASAAVSEPMLLMDRWSAWSDTSDETRAYTLPQMLGDPVADAEMLREISPLQQAARLKLPLLMIHGAQDRRVPLEHAQRMRAALEQAGNPPQWLLFADEAHGWLKPANVGEYARQLEGFLAQHLLP